MNKQQGFTLIEMAIVLVIIGLLIGGVLKGQELIENSKTKAVVNDMKAVQTAYNGYIDRYKAIPGDETANAMTARGWLGANAGIGGNGNSVLQIPLNDTFAHNNAEHRGFWRAVRGSQLMTGDLNAAAGVASLPLNGANGRIGIVTNAPGGLVYGQSGIFVCASGLTTKQVTGIDVMIDGPLPANQIGNSVGVLRATTGVANPLAPQAAVPVGVAYDETNQVNPWTACMRI